jgi:ketosteroid isomerase-like protein
MTQLTPQEMAVLRAEIAALVDEFAYLVDHGRAEEVVDLLTEDAVFASSAGEDRGRAALSARFAARARAADRTTRHVCANLRLEVLAPDRVRGTVGVAVYRHDGAGMGRPIPLSVGDWEDLYVRGADGRWRMAERRFVRAFAGEE